MTYASEVAADSPLMYLKMNETSGTTLADSSGNGRDATLSGTYTLNQTGLLVGGDACVQFNPGKAAVASASWMNVTSAVTFECWVTFTSLSGFAGILSRWQNGGGTAVGLLWVNSSGKLSFDLMVNGVQRHVEGASAAVGTTYHLVGTYDGSNVNLYVNGTLAQSTAATGNIATGTSDICLAEFAGTASARAYIDEPAFYSTALSATRVAAHYSAGRGNATVALGQATETDSTGTLSAIVPQTVALGRASETDTANAATVIQTQFVTVGRASETDSTDALAALLGAGPLGQTVETDSAQSLTAALGAVSVSLAQATEGDSATAMGVAQDQTAALGQADETDEALPLTLPGFGSILRVVETDTARPLTVVNAFPVSTDTTNRGNGRRRTGYLVLEVEYPTDATPTGIEPVRMYAQTSPTPTYDTNGEPA